MLHKYIQYSTLHTDASDVAGAAMPNSREVGQEHSLHAEAIATKLKEDMAYRSHRAAKTYTRRWSAGACSRCDQRSRLAGWRGTRGGLRARSSFIVPPL